MKKEIAEYLDWKGSYTISAKKAYSVPLKRLKKLDNLTDIVNFKNSESLIYAPSNVAYSMTVVRDFVTYLWYQKRTNINPKLIKIPKFIPVRRSVSKSEDVVKMIDVWRIDKFTELRNRVIIAMLADTAMRVSELLDIKIADISKNTAIVRTKKTTNERVVMWSEKTNKELLQYLGVRLCLSDTENLFITTDNNNLCVRQVQRIISNTCKKAGVEKHITAHSFRHGKAHDMLSRGANVKEIATVLGHSENNPEASFHYLRLDNQEITRILKKFI